jgi:peptidoglycan/xylan/chitin deacetylase (PgdA/CDA1 family)
LFPSCIWKLNGTREKILYLTFDDGPIQEVTPWVLDKLDAYGAKATFFCIGDNVKKNAAIFRSILDRGHAVGNHTQTHRNGWNTLYSDYLKDVTDCAALVPSNLFRPPYGKLKPLQLRAIRKDFNIIMWSFITGDYLKDLDGEKVFETMKAKLVSGDIVVFHDSLKAEHNLRELLPRFLDHYTAEGYTFKAIQIN